MNTSLYLSNLKIEELNPMQEQVRALPMATTDLLLLSPTGSGKTLAFLLWVLKRLDANKQGVQALVLAPTRELALQIESVFKAMKTGFKVNCFYGGHAIQMEKNSLKEPPALLIGTAGRIDDLLKRKVLNLENTQTLVLDEYDKSLEMGFEEQMKYIVGKMRKRSNTMLTSATKSRNVPDYISVANSTVLDYLSDADAESKLVLKKISCDKTEKSAKLIQLLHDPSNLPALVFLTTKESIAEVEDLLYNEGVFFTAYHGDLDQSARERNLVKFRNGSVNVLVATDLASRGIDVPEIKSVIHFHQADKGDVFIHRNGRTARMHAEGTAYVFVGDKPKPYLPSDLSEHIFIPASGYEMPAWETLYIDKGKKNKVSKGDVAGFVSKNANLNRDEIGFIEVKDLCSYVAVKRTKVLTVIAALKKLKIKGKSCRVEVAL